MKVLVLVLLAVAAFVTVLALSGSSDPGSEVAWRWVEVPNCGEYAEGCWQLRVTAKKDCANGLYGEVNLVDKTGTTVDYANDSLGRLAAGRSAILTFEGLWETGVDRAEVSKLECF